MRYLFLIPNILLRKHNKTNPGSWIDRHVYRDTVIAAYSLQISRPRLDHYSDLVLVIQIEITVSYNDSTFGYI